MIGPSMTLSFLHDNMELCFYLLFFIVVWVMLLVISSSSFMVVFYYFSCLRNPLLQEFLPQLRTQFKTYERTFFQEVKGEL